MTDTSGRTLPEPLAYYDHGSLCWRTCQGSLLSQLPPLLETLPPSVMWDGQWLYGLPTSVPATDEPDGSASLLTPTQADGTGGGRADPPQRGKGKDGSGGLREQVRTLPTPMARDHHDTGDLTNLDERSILPRVVHNHLGNLLPTPRASKAMSDNQETTLRAVEANGYKARLQEAVALCSTPTARLGDPRGAQAARYENSDRSNDLDDAVAWIGDHSPPLSDDTSNSSDAE